MKRSLLFIIFTVQQVSSQYAQKYSNDFLNNNVDIATFTMEKTALTTNNNVNSTYHLTGIKISQGATMHTEYVAGIDIEHKLQFNTSKEIEFHPNIGIGFKDNSIQIDDALTNNTSITNTLDSNVFSINIAFDNFI